MAGDVVGPCGKGRCTSARVNHAKDLSPLARGARDCARCAPRRRVGDGGSVRVYVACAASSRRRLDGAAPGLTSTGCVVRSSEGAAATAARRGGPDLAPPSGSSCLRPTGRDRRGARVDRWSGEPPCKTSGPTPPLDTGQLSKEVVTCLNH